MDDSGLKVDVASAQCKEFSEAESGEAGQKEQRSVSLLDRVGEAEDDLSVDERSLG